MPILNADLKCVWIYSLSNIQVEKDGTKIVFSCMHGKSECDGNRLQSCVLDALADDQGKQVQFMTCQMNKNAESSGQVVSQLFL